MDRRSSWLRRVGGRWGSCRMDWWLGMSATALTRSPVWRGWLGPRLEVDMHLGVLHCRILLARWFGVLVALHRMKGRQRWLRVARGVLKLVTTSISPGSMCSYAYTHVCSSHGPGGDCKGASITQLPGLTNRIHMRREGLGF